MNVILQAQLHCRGLHDLLKGNDSMVFRFGDKLLHFSISDLIQENSSIKQDIELGRASQATYWSRSLDLQVRF